MLQVCFGVYLILTLLVMVWLWAALVTSRIHDTNEGHDRQRLYRIMLAISKFKDAGYRKEYNPLEDAASLGELSFPVFNPHE